MFAPHVECHSHREGHVYRSGHQQNEHIEIDKITNKIESAAIIIIININIPLPLTAVCSSLNYQVLEMVCIKKHSIDLIHIGRFVRIQLLVHAVEYAAEVLAKGVDVRVESDHDGQVAAIHDHKTGAHVILNGQIDQMCA